MIIETTKLGLAAYISMNSGVLKDISSDGVFTFETSTDLDEWELRYLSSESRKHDNELISLRNLLARKKR